MRPWWQLRRRGTWGAEQAGVVPAVQDAKMGWCLGSKKGLSPAWIRIIKTISVIIQSHAFTPVIWFTILAKNAIKNFM